MIQIGTEVSKIVEEKLSLFTLFQKQIPENRLDAFLSELPVTEESVPAYLAFSIQIPSVDPLAAIEQVPDPTSFQYYWEKPVDDFAIAASGELSRIVTKGENRFREASRKGKELINSIHHYSGINHLNAVIHLFGGFSFFDKNDSNSWSGFKSSSFTLPEWTIIKEGRCSILTFCFSFSDRSRVYEQVEQTLLKLEPITSASSYTLNGHQQNGLEVKVPDKTSEEYRTWVNTVNSAKSEILEGKFDKVVLARKIDISLNQTVKDTHILNKLRLQYPDCYSFLIRQNEEASFLGCTPERLASFSSDYVLTEGLAGSTSRGKTASEDAVLEYDLLHSPKDLEEHEIVLEAIEESLNYYSDEVNHPGKPIIKKLSNVQHLYTPITARIKEGVSRTEVLKTLHPTPAVGGFPRDEAVSFIKEHEDFERGWYAAPFGWINAHGNGEFVVAIRSGLIMKDSVRFFAGCGIVKNSDPDKEWDETNLKFIPMLSTLEHARS